jgi:O-antigen ligase
MLVIVAGLILLGVIGLVGVIAVQPGVDALERLGLLFGLIGTGAAALVAALRADAAAIDAKSIATSINGTLDERIKAAVVAANSERRFTDDSTPPVPK